jgi:hypothetical protein
MAIFKVHPEICQTFGLNAKDKEELKQHMEKGECREIKNVARSKVI